MQQPQYNQNLEGNWCWPLSLRESERSGPSSLQYVLLRVEGKKIQTLNVLFLIYSCVKAEAFITFIQSYKNVQQVYVGFSYIL